MAMWTKPRPLAVAAALLLAGCSHWQRDNYGVPDASSIRLKQTGGQWTAQGPDCRRLLQPERNWMDDDRWQIAFGCATYNNLAASVARPQDLTAPHRLADGQADAATLAVERYRTNKVEPLLKTESTTKATNK